MRQRSFSEVDTEKTESVGTLPFEEVVWSGMKMIRHIGSSTIYLLMDTLIFITV